MCRDTGVPLDFVVCGYLMLFLSHVKRVLNSLMLYNENIFMLTQREYFYAIQNMSLS